jgi:predicted signal transduction protein with EAL and GGDEF domain
MFDGAVLSIRASAGIALTRGSGSAVDDVLREADLALYQAKADGKGVARRYDPAQFAAAEQRRREEAELRAALDRHECEVHYQPIVDLDGEHTVGVEALVRWQSVAEAVLQIARTFNLSPVAEGVEDALTASRLRELDCAQAQGYHFARPMPAGEVTDLLGRQGALQL